jgi:predicted CoA-substrate-specific enzyme activase
MIVAGCDVGSMTAKAVILKDGELVSSHIIKAGPSPEKSAQEVINAALEKVGITLDTIEYCVGTGYGRNEIPFAHAIESEIACHGKGAQWKMPSARTIIDIGGQDAKAIKLDNNGNVIQYVYNDKCASGSGRFLEVMAAALGINLHDLGEISLKSNNPVTMSNQCVIFAETEIISLVNEGKPLQDIISGLHKALAHRVAALAKSIGLEDDIIMTGGVAKNVGMLNALEKALGKPIKPCIVDPQINGALGAALFALEALEGKKS